MDATPAPRLDVSDAGVAIDARLPIQEAGQANALLESREVIGNVVLVAPELLSSS
jgi:hypothetical protein